MKSEMSHPMQAQLINIIKRTILTLCTKNYYWTYDFFLLIMRAGLALIQTRTRMSWAVMYSLPSSPKAMFDTGRFKRNLPISFPS